MRGLLGGETYAHPSLNVSAQRCVNLYPETVRVEGAKATTVFRAVPGKAAFATLVDSPASAIFQEDGRCFIVANTDFCEVNAAGVVTVHGTVAASSPQTPATMCSNGVQNGGEIFITSGGVGYIFTLATNTFEIITDAQFPTGVISGHYIDGYFIAVTASGFYLSDLLDGTSWSGDAGTRVGASDALVVGVSDHEVLWLFGSKRTEVWFDAGTAAFPFEPVPGVFIEYGLAAAGAVTAVGDSLVWLGQSARGDRCIVRNQGYNPLPISNPAIDALLADLTVISDARAFSYSIPGHVFAVVTFPTDGLTLQYDLHEQAWSELAYWNTATATWEADRMLDRASVFGLQLAIDRSRRTLWRLSPSLHADGDDARVWLRRAPHVTHEHQQLFFPYYELEAAVGVGLTSGHGSDPQVRLRVSDDGGHTWGPELWRSLGALGQYGQRVRWNRMGGSRNRVVELSGSDPVETTLIDLYNSARVGEH